MAPLGNGRVRDEDLADLVGELHRHRLALPEPARIVVQLGQSQDVCGDLFDGRVAVLDVDAGKTWVIANSRCMVTDSRIGWIDMGVLSPSTGRN